MTTDHPPRARAEGLEVERKDFTVHRLTVRPDETYDLNGLPITAGPRTYADLAARLDREMLAASRARYPALRT